MYRRYSVLIKSLLPISGTPPPKENYNIPGLSLRYTELNTLARVKNIKWSVEERRESQINFAAGLSSVKIYLRFLSISRIPPGEPPRVSFSFCFFSYLCEFSLSRRADAPRSLDGAIPPFPAALSLELFRRREQSTFVHLSYPLFSVAVVCATSPS